MTDDKTPVLVGVAAANQRFEEAGEGLEPIELMIAATRGAAEDASPSAAGDLLSAIDDISVPNGIWSYTNPAGLIASAVGADHAKTVFAEVGILQHTLVSRACSLIASGEASVTLVAGGEAKYRALRAQIAGIELAESNPADMPGAPSLAQDGGDEGDSSDPSVPDLFMQPHAELWNQVESAAGLGMPVGYYAIMDSALRHEQGESIDEHRDHMARMYAGFSQIAAANPDAWVREPVEAEYIRNPSPKNKMLAFPYTKLHNTQWNVDQSSALLFCSVAKARELGIPESKWVYPLAAAESNFMSVVSARRALHRSQGFALAGQRAFEAAGCKPEDVQHMELYSCFPSAVRVQMAELGVNAHRPLSVTGAMTFGGGPLNNFVFQATVKLAQVLRDNPGDTGMVTCISSFITKQGVALYSTEPCAGDFQALDVTEEVEQATPICEVVPSHVGDATVAGYTVLYQGDGPWRGVAVCDLPDGSRTVAYTEDADTMARMEAEDYCGRVVTLAGNVIINTQ